MPTAWVMFLYSPKKAPAQPWLLNPGRLNLSIEPFIGVSADFINPGILAGLYPSPLPLEHSGDTINNLVADIHRVNSQGFSLQAGMNLQLRQKCKDRVALTFYYNQGLVTLNEYNVTYYIRSDRMAGQNYRTLLNSRASALVINLSYAIRLYSREAITTPRPDDKVSLPIAKSNQEQPLRLKNYRKIPSWQGSTGGIIPHLHPPTGVSAAIWVISPLIIF